MVYEGLNQWEKQKALERTYRKQVSERIQTQSGESEYVIKRLKTGVQLIYYTREGGRWRPEDRVFIPDELREELLEILSRVWNAEANK
ncbi:MAG: hypothetical protein QF415_07495 [Candidatus Undinarchaeales archaeon]|jgi:hypothetical protein|nr:hypothetical protein [Candidatus Undinarchaeales archaeon]MDP7492308.1 hypothetical protein [Candidatus Undinarchaeales archaeon]